MTLLCTLILVIECAPMVVVSSANHIFGRTICAVNQSFVFILKIHLLPIFFLFLVSSHRSQVPFSFIDSISTFIASSHCCLWSLAKACFKVFGSSTESLTKFISSINLFVGSSCLLLTICELQYRCCDHMWWLRLALKFSATIPNYWPTSFRQSITLAASPCVLLTTCELQYRCLDHMWWFLESLHCLTRALRRCQVSVPGIDVWPSSSSSDSSSALNYSSSSLWLIVTVCSSWIYCELIFQSLSLGIHLTSRLMMTLPVANT